MKFLRTQRTIHRFTIYDDYGNTIEVDDVVKFVRELADKVPMHLVHEILLAFRDVSAAAQEAHAKWTEEQYNLREARLNTPG